MEAEQARQAVAEAGHMLQNEGLVARTWGNVSCRTGEASFAITPSGLAYDNMCAEDVVLYDALHGTWDGSRKPSSEKGVHAAAYACFPDAGFVIHTHQTYASALGLAGFDACTLSDEDRAALGGLALAGYGLPGSKKLAKHTEAALAGGAHTVLMAHHGALIVGRDREEAFARAKRLETVSRACVKGQPEREPEGNAALGRQITEMAAALFEHAACTAQSAVLTAAEAGKFCAQLDDMAQMIGPELVVAPAQTDKILSALQKHDAVLVAGVGAFCRAKTEGDCLALCMLIEKACVCRLHTLACGVDGTLPRWESQLMRYVYLKKYSKKIGG